MKKKDISVIVSVALGSAVFSFVLSNLLFSSKKDRSQVVEVVEQISTEFKTPDPTYFNRNSKNPSQNIQIGTDQNSNPFGSQ
jgi:hypothetical protein